ELTQLKNRRAFFELGRQALKVAHREHDAYTLFFVDLNGLKQINDQLGHLSGDQALRDTAAVLLETFRDCDIVARYGGDEFVVLAQVSMSGGAEALRERLYHHFRQFNLQNSRPYRLEVSVGVAVAEGEGMPDIETLIAHADEEMYREKRGARP